jgi:hypothetical protein
MDGLRMCGASTAVVGILFWSSYGSVSPRCSCPQFCFDDVEKPSHFTFDYLTVEFRLRQETCDGTKIKVVWGLKTSNTFFPRKILIGGMSHSANLHKSLVHKAGVDRIERA